MKRGRWRQERGRFREKGRERETEGGRVRERDGGREGGGGRDRERDNLVEEL